MHVRKDKYSGPAIPIVMIMTICNSYYENVRLPL